jgi:hypothetical protein
MCIDSLGASAYQAALSNDHRTQSAPLLRPVLQEHVSCEAPTGLCQIGSYSLMRLKKGLGRF